MGFGARVGVGVGVRVGVRVRVRAQQATRWWLLAVLAAQLDEGVAVQLAQVLGRHARPPVQRVLVLCDHVPHQRMRTPRARLHEGRDSEVRERGPRGGKQPVEGLVPRCLAAGVGLTHHLALRERLGPDAVRAAVVACGATVRGMHGTRGSHAYGSASPGPSCPAPRVRTARRRLVHVARTYSMEAAGRTCVSLGSHEFQRWSRCRRQSRRRNAQPLG